ncbi:hypothetical protein [Caballeronia sp. SBC2]|uniref:hypothetical protein n=1 Tax=Caballeronia sp. SBC2 TaxID=2705547 RepID=UPI0013E11730|nr:hypothetical protein [Caballeronia sp. SBC2]QIE23005.1 hypothetical protein SBC2_10180 [Caballeronia sp. SBC2]
MKVFPSRAGQPYLHPSEQRHEQNPNADRSYNMNPNNSAYDDGLDNHSNQLYPNNERYQGGDDDSDYE